MPENEWRIFFDAHAPIYEDNVFTKATMAEVDFLVGELKLEKGDRVLDVGCGTGRHAVELARRGLVVTGLDISENMLSRARSAASAAGVSVRLIQGDATRDLPDGPFDVALSLCEGAFGLLGSGDDAIEQPVSILSGMADRLVPGGWVVITVLNGLRAARASGGETFGDFDPVTMTETSEVTERSPDGEVRVTVRERSFVPPELALMARCAGLELRALYGGTAGSWGRRPVKLDEMEIMMVARKPGAAGEASDR
jgi:cyclopropane fatty-acyl-phospholipid synthase-like methyltransferase